MKTSMDSKENLQETDFLETIQKWGGGGEGSSFNMNMITSNVKNYCHSKL